MSGEGFLARWSRRKRAAEAGRPDTEPAAAPAAAAPAPVHAPATAPVPGAAPAFDPASLPPLESLTLESDFTAFLRKEVPEALKRAALRKAWALDPAIRDFVGPAEYAWDFNAPDGVPGFALELGGDAAKLLAQAMGLGPEEGATLPAASDATPQEAAGPDREAVPAPPAEPPAPVRLAGPAEAPAEVPAPAGPEEAPARRRHGSALPS